jgi:hypothetical protein
LSRCLLSTTRAVLQDAAGYRSAWQSLHELAQTRDARAWLFRDAWNPDRYIEFIEWKQATEGPLELAPELAAAHRALDQFGVGNTEQWLEP